MMQPFHLTEVQHFALAVCLVVSGLTCLFSAYHLHRRPFLPGTTVLLHADSNATVDVNAHHRQTELSEQGHYLSYLPHSGLHNQRIALENALTLASALNRTLLLPPARLGSKPAIHYAPSNALQQTLLGALLNSSTEQCSVNLNKMHWCETLGEATHVPWHWLLDLSSLGPEFSVWAPHLPSYPWLDGSEPLLAEDNASFFDASLYAHRIIDFSLAESTPLGRYLSTLDLETLKNVTARHLRLGSLFGSARLLFRQTRHASLRRHVRANMVLSNPLIDSLAAIVVEKLGGPDTYFAAHLRVADGQFSVDSRGGARAAWFMLVSRTLGSFAKAETLEIKLFNSTRASDDYRLNHYRTERVITSPIPDSSPSRLPYFRRQPRSLACYGKLHEEPDLAALNTPVFLATDAQAGDPRLEQFTRTFPCTFRLADILPFNATVIVPRASLLLSDKTTMGDAEGVYVKLAQLRSSFDNASLIPYLAPLVDARIAAQAAVVAGTPDSTFSSHLIDVGWPRFHGLEIVQRG